VKPLGSTPHVVANREFSLTERHLPWRTPRCPPQWIDDLRAGLPRAIMRDVGQTDQARSRANVRQLRSPLADGRPSRYFYWDDVPSLREQMTSEDALEQTKAFALRCAREARDKAPDAFDER
jgi:hypothetical protein